MREQSNFWWFGWATVKYRIREGIGGKGRGNKNNNGEKIIKLFVENDLVTASTKFKRKDTYKYTRAEISSNEKSLVDYFL